MQKLTKFVESEDLPLSSADDEHEEMQYLTLMSQCINAGVKKPNRTGIATRSVFGMPMVFNLAEERKDGSVRRIMPLLTTKKINYENIVKELLFFISGKTDTTILEKQGVMIWKDNTTREFLDKRGLNKYAVGDMGPGYGYQWRHFGAPYRGCNGNYTGLGVDQLQNAIETIRKDPYDRRIIVSAWNPAQLKEMALPPCFMPGTLTLTRDGYKPIEEVTDNDYLYTHTGVFKPILTRHITDYRGEVIDLDIAYHPHVITATPEHPFYARKVIHGKVESPTWVTASKLGPFHYVGMKINDQSIIPEFSIEKNAGNHNVIEHMTLDKPDYWFMMGFFLGDGWLRKNDPQNAKIFFSMNAADMETAYPRIEKVFKLCHLKPSEYTTNCFKLQAHNQFWFKILSEFGHGAKNKHIPEWVQSAPVEMIEEFLHGYNVADGSYHSGNDGIGITTTSVNIALGIQRLYAKIGIVVGVCYRDPRPKVIIQGREVKESRLYSIQKRFGRDNKQWSFIADGYAWFYIRDYTVRPVKDVKVYNFAVTDDHTYTVENLTVHNCHLYYQFDVEPDPRDRSPNPKPKYLRCMMVQRSADVPLGVPYNIASYATLTHMVAQLTGLIAKELVIVTGDTHVYENQVEACAIQLNRDPKPFPTLTFTFPPGQTPKTIDDFKLEHFKLEGYDPHPFIKYPFAT